VFRSPLAVLRGQLYGTEPVNGDAEDGVYGAQAERVVYRQPEVTQDLAEGPMFAFQQIHRVQRHRHGPDEEIAHRERGYEVVGRLAYGTFEEEGEKDDEVTGDGNERCAGGE